MDSQSPIRAEELSDPESDVFVLNQPTDNFAETPDASDCLLVVEISDSTLNWDRTEKLKIYARAEVAEYWIVDINYRRLLVHRRPSGEEYLDIRTHTEEESIAPLAQAEAPVPVASLLP